jgi:anti-sigma regulatory factor (Ser/Thr protein kinase)
VVVGTLRHACVGVPVNEMLGPEVPTGLSSGQELALTGQAADHGLRHVAWRYETPQAHLAAIDEFVRAGLADGEPVLIAAPWSGLPADWRPPEGRDVIIADMADAGRNPARVIPLIQEFLLRYASRPVRCLAESAWPGRSAAELQEAARHEALINLAFAGSDIQVLCPYNGRTLPQPVLSDARRTHPWLRQHGVDEVCPDYLEPEDYLAALDKPLVAPATASCLNYERDLRPVRAMVSAAAQAAGLSPSRCTDLVIAASELAANTLRHAAGAGVIRVWLADGEVLCQIEDNGYIANPLAGSRRPARDLPGGQGLWLVNQVCDLTEIRTSEYGTTIRLHMSL